MFADYTPLLPGLGGHPNGLEWFCDLHLQAASELRMETADVALELLQVGFGKFPPYRPKPHRDPELWVTDVGPNPSRIFAIIRESRWESPAAVRALLQEGKFKVAQGWPRSFAQLKGSLIEAGAAVVTLYP